MSLSLFMSILSFGSVLTGLITEAIKDILNSKEKHYSSNVIALCVSIVVGCVGCAICYLFLNIPFTFNNIICLVLMGGAVWLSSMVGYDKIAQLIKQLIDIEG